MRVSLGLPALLIGLCGGGLFAAETPTTTAAGPATATLVPARVTLEPGSFLLSGPRSRLQLLFTGFTSEQQRFDLTHAATYRSSNEQVARLEGSRVVPVGDGTATITAEAAGQSATCEITVSKFAEPQPVSFKNETQMALTRTGCNMGACHGSPSGKGGFRLSLRAYDSALDTMTLLHHAEHDERPLQRLLKLVRLVPGLVEGLSQPQKIDRAESSPIQVPELIDDRPNAAVEAFAGQRQDRTPLSQERLPLKLRWTGQLLVLQPRHTAIAAVALHAQQGRLRDHDVLLCDESFFCSHVDYLLAATAHVSVRLYTSEPTRRSSRLAECPGADPSIKL